VVGRQVSVRARLAAAGLEADQALPRLREAGLVDEDDRADADLLALLSEAADPQGALLAVTELAQQQPEAFERVRADGAWLARVVTLAGVSRPLGDLLARYPDAVEALRTLDGVEVPTVADEVAEGVAAHADLDDQAAAVAGIRRRATADIAARDLTAVSDVDDVCRELAGLAEAVLTGTLRAVHQQLTDGQPRARIAVIGMGKLGGHELNYVSDVDVVFVHEPVDGDEDAASTEARSVLVRVLELLNASTTMGRAYEIDSTLRPEGRTGALSRTVESYVAYWERWAKTWEFQALIKARPVAGDLELGQRLLDAAEPFVWPERLDPEVVAEIRTMKSRIERKPEVMRHGERQIKLGPGGIRDIEFAVQLLQLVHGRGDVHLRETGTLDALRALVRGGYVADDDAREFADAYRMLRTVEHRLQLAQERRTHTIPDDDARQEWLARSLGYRAADDAPARDAFLKDLGRIQARVRELHAKLFYRPLLEAHASVPAADAGMLAPTGEGPSLGEEAAVERLVALGFRDGRAAVTHVRRLTAGVSRRARTLRAVLPAILQVLQDTPDPDAGLASFRDLLEAHGDSTQLLSRLRDHPPAADLLARVLGTSRVAGELLVGQPRGVDWLHDDALRDQPRTRDQLVRKALGRLHWQDTTDALRRFKRHELLRIVLRDLNHDTSVAGVGEELTALGEACLEGALRAELSAQAARRGVADPRELPVRMAIVGMGKLGGRELHYVSDLDVLFVHEAVEDGDESEATSLALEVAGNVMRSLSAITAEGTAFDVDADLRPEGRSGALSRTLDSYEAYWQRWSEPWEHQSLLRARPVAGDSDLGARLVAAASTWAYPESFGDAEATRMRRMKVRIEQERLPKRVDASRHLKLGPGGLSDIEWTVQLLQQQRGRTHRALRTPSTLQALDTLQDADLIEHRDAVWLRDAYRFLSHLRNRLYLLRYRNVDVVPTSQDELERLARSLGYDRGEWQQLDDDRRRHARHVRRVCERVFYGIEPDPSLVEDR
jgi:[glutamine synthetase] adenylyltransferase / [glutamine synthetase]-adenylyl-L-tyrosine phosphorylase